MTSNLDAYDDPRQPHQRNRVAPERGENDQPMGTSDNLKRDRFELLSAYLDGEVTASERRQVEQWLKSDPSAQHLHARLLRLRQGVRNLPVPASEQPVEQTVKRVIRRIDRGPRMVMTWGSVAIAAVFVSALFGDISGTQRYLPQMVQSPDASSVSTDALMIALDRPVIDIPKAPVSGPSDMVDMLYVPSSEIR